MDDIKSKLSALVSRATNTAKLNGKKFAGQGQRLGTAEEHGTTAKPKIRNPAHYTSTASSSNTTGARSLAPSSVKQPSAGTQSSGPQQLSSIAPSQGTGAHILKPATEFDGFTAVVGSGAALGANRTATASLAADRSTAQLPASSVLAQSAPSAPALQQGSHSLQPAQLHRQAAVSADQVDEMQHCLALIASQPAVAGSSMEVLSKILSNLAAAPQEVRYRQLRLSNPRIHTLIVKVSGAEAFLAAVGFQIHAADPGAAAAVAAGGDDDRFAVLIDDQQLGLVHEGLRQLQGAFPAAQSAQDQHLQQSALAAAPAQQQRSAVTNTSPPAAQQHDGDQPNPLAPPAASLAPSTGVSAAPRIARETLVLLPAAPDTTVPDWFFERTGAELKADYMATLRARQAGEVVASKAWKAAQLGRQTGARPTVAVIRVRFPEGVCLQRKFNVSEPVTEVFEWVTESLRDPAISYELIKPDRKPLPNTGSVGAADLAPAVLLNFRLLSGQHAFYAGSVQQKSFLQDSLLAQAQAD